MDFGNITIGGITLYLFILGIVEAAKRFGIFGNGSLILSIALGAVLFGLFRANEMGLVPAEVWLWVEVVIYGLGGGLAVSGLYDWTKRLRG